jgi:hypothetical protein
MFSSDQNQPLGDEGICRLSYQLFLKHLDLITHLEQIKKFDDILVTYALRRKPSLRSSSTSSTLNAMIFTPGTFLQSQELRRDRS